MRFGILTLSQSAPRHIPQATLYSLLQDLNFDFVISNVTEQNGLTLVLVQVLQVMVMVMWVLLVIKRSCCRRLVMVERILAVYGHWMVQ